MGQVQNNDPRRVDEKQLYYHRYANMTGRNLLCRQRIMYRSRRNNRSLDVWYIWKIEEKNFQANFPLSLWSGNDLCRQTDVVSEID